MRKSNLLFSADAVDLCYSHSFLLEGYYIDCNMPPHLRMAIAGFVMDNAIALAF